MASADSCFTSAPTAGHSGSAPGEIPLRNDVTSLLPAELLYEICWIVRHHLYETADPSGQHSKAMRRDLASLALTCRSFCSPALDFLWEEMHSLVPLLRGLVPEVQLERLADGSTMRPISYMLVGPVSPDKWLRWDLYRQRIRFLRPSEFPLSPAIFDTLARVRPQGLPMLPNLEELAWENYGSTSALANFITPSLKRLSIGRSIGLGYFERNRDLRALEYVISILPEVALGIRSIELSNQETFGRSLQGLVQLILLEHLCLRDPIDEEVFSGLCLLTQIKSISLCVRTLPAGDLSAWPSFPQLEKITFIYSSLPSVIAVLQHLSTTALSQFSLESGSEERIGMSPEGLRATFSTLSPFHQTLKVVRIVNIFAFAHDLEFLCPLLECHEMTEFDFRFLIPSSEMDNDISHLANAWPRLEKLLISCRINPRSLVVLARECPCLQHVRVGHINMIELPPLDTYEEICPHGLQSLRTETVGVVDLVEGMAFLESLFPALAHNNADDGLRDGLDFYMFLRQVRKDRQSDLLLQQEPPLV